MKTKNMMMKRNFLLILSIVLVLSLITNVQLLNVSARVNGTANFNRSYTLTGNGATDMVNIARAQLGKNGGQLGYSSEEWCADFVSDCAILAGQSTAIPANDNCGNMQTAIRNAGGDYISASEARPGDILFYGSGGGAHVEIVYAQNGSTLYTLSTIGGNSGNANNSLSMVKDHPNQSGQPTPYKVMRPNYSNQWVEESGWNVPVTVTASSKVYVYYFGGGMEPDRYIDPGDECYIDKVYIDTASGIRYVHVRYPISTGTRWSYAKLSDLLSTPPQIPTGYSISISSTSIYNCERVDITIDPYDDNVTNYKLYVKYPSGITQSADLGGKNQVGLWLNKVGTYKIYAEISNEYGSFKGSETDGCVEVNVTKPSMGSKVNLGTDFDAYIVHKSSGNVLTNDGDNVSSRTKTSNLNQQWHFTRKSDGSYEIASVSGNGKCLDEYSGKGRQGDNVQVYKLEGEPLQSWYIYSAGENAYYLMPTSSESAVLDVDNASSESGANVAIWSFHGEDAQIFKIEKLVNSVTIHYNTNGGTIASDSDYYADSNGDIYQTSNNEMAAQVWANGYKGAYGLVNASTFKLSRTGYKFLGWSLIQTGGKVYDQNDATVSANDFFPDVTTKSGTVTMYAQWELIEKSVYGDVNADGKLTVADVTMLQRWLLADGTRLNNWQAADLCKDGTIDVFDMIEMRKLLVQNK